MKSRPAGNRSRKTGPRPQGQAPFPPVAAGPRHPHTPPGAGYRPLTPRPVLFWGLLIGFAAWVAVLLAIYFVTVYPLRHAHSS